MLDPLLSAPIAVQLHVATVLPAAVLGLFLLLARKGDRRHKMLGKLWLALMAVSALSSFFIHQIRLWGDFSPIHLLSVFVLYSSFAAIRAARAGRIAAHRRHVRGLYLGGIVGAGLFTLLPGRLMNRLLLSEDGPMLLLGLALALLLAALLARGAAGQRRRSVVERI